MAQQTREQTGDEYQLQEHLLDILAQVSNLNAMMSELRSVEIRRLIDSGIALHDLDAKFLMEDFDKAADCISSAIGNLADYIGTITRATMFRNIKEGVV